MIEPSRGAILAELGDPPDITFVRSAGNVGDELIWAGTRELLADRIYREVDLAGLCSAAGHTALLSGGGGFCRPFHDLMPRALAVASMRFERVILLPSSFDPSEDEVRDALSATTATVFAREPDSFERIVGLCDARLALDCAFFFDYRAYGRRGEGTLNAFRTDREARPGRHLPPDNDDISLTAEGLDQWLARISAHELVRTDRAHVMIAAALLGKRVQFASSSYHKLPSIARYALSGYPVTPLEDDREIAAAIPNRRAILARGQADAPARVTAIVLSRSRPELALRAIDSITASEVRVDTIVIDNNSAEADAAELAEGCSRRQGIELRRTDRNLGCAGGRRLAIEKARGELLLLLDDDAELEPGALDALVTDLDDHPEAAAVTATVLLPDGIVHHSGGWLETGSETARFGLIGRGVPGSSSLPATGPADWVPGTAVLIRREALLRFPLDDRMSSYYEDNEWCYRVRRELPGSFRRSLEARAVHHFSEKHRAGTDYLTRSVAVELLSAHARFYELHGKLLDLALFDLVPELRDGDGICDLAAARLLMELLLAKGTDWLFANWMSGELDGLLGSARRVTALRAQVAERERELAELRELATFLHHRHEKLIRVESGGWWRLRGRLLPALRAFWWLRGRKPD